MHQARPLAEPRIEMVEGRMVRVIDRRPPLPPTLAGLIAAMRVTWRTDVRPTGARSECLREEHRLLRFIEGRHVGLDGVVRDLRLLMCADCESVCVRDVSLDGLAGAPAARPVRVTNPSTGTSRIAPAVARRDGVLGWYTGARPSQRVFM